jgi:DNA polymerase-3 subunit epsilon
VSFEPMHINAKTPLVFVDLETTGTSPKHHRVIEVGIVRVEDGVVVAEYKTLVNPGTLVPAFITSLTGISTAMLVDAPAFDEVALEIQELLEGAVFVAHSVLFDYGFLQAEFKALGMDFSYPYLCTAKLSRQLYPRCRRHNLDSIIERYDLSAGDRHRALDDARVLHQFLEVTKASHGAETLYETMEEMVRVRRLPQHIKERQITKLPDTPGVYFFYGKKDELLYIGKSRRIRTRVRSHFAKDGLSGKGRDMLSEIRRIDYQETAGEVGALILESYLIKKQNPIYNVRSRERRALYVVREDINSDGYATVSHG